jgi:hypothetical protein
MSNRYLFWIRTTAVLQIITASIHAMSFLRNHVAANETERQLNEILTTYRPDLGPYFHPTMGDLFTALSACFTFLFLLGGVTNLFLAQKNLSQEIWKGLTSISLVIFGACFLVTLNFAFLSPIILTGIVFVGLCFAYATNHIHKIKLPKN